MANESRHTPIDMDDMTIDELCRDRLKMIGNLEMPPAEADAVLKNIVTTLSARHEGVFTRIWRGPLHSRWLFGGVLTAVGCVLLLCGLREYGTRSARFPQLHEYSQAEAACAARKWDAQECRRRLAALCPKLTDADQPQCRKLVEAGDATVRAEVKRFLEKIK